MQIMQHDLILPLERRSAPIIRARPSVSPPPRRRQFPGAPPLETSRPHWDETMNFIPFCPPNHKRLAALPFHTFDPLSVID